MQGSEMRWVRGPSLLPMLAAVAIVLAAVLLPGALVAQDPDFLDTLPAARRATVSGKTAPGVAGPPAGAEAVARREGNWPSPAARANWQAARAHWQDVQDTWPAGRGPGSYQRLTSRGGPDLTLRVADVAQAQAEVARLAGRVGGRIVHVAETSWPGGPSVVLKVEAPRQAIGALWEGLVKERDGVRGRGALGSHAAERSACAPGRMSATEAGPPTFLRRPGAPPPRPGCEELRVRLVRG